MWMSRLTPVTMSAMTAESGSKRKAASTVKLPAEIQVYKVSRSRRCSAGRFSRSENESAAKKKEIKMASEPSRPPAFSPRSFFPARPLARKPASGGRRIHFRSG